MVNEYLPIMTNPECNLIISIKLINITIDNKMFPIRMISTVYRNEESGTLLRACRFPKMVSPLGLEPRTL